ncbi:DNA repair exonuclease [Sulfurimonas sp. HSL3-7]|uniref:metallophosphoesterase family protein n=1 Tax=Sulfonitrofixus jiaomeiensis TaxID=3131938 RepID=UPI0031F85E6C
MKIIHFSDTHLGFSDLDVVNEAGINQREADFYKAFSDVIDAIVETRPDYVMHTGDLFHRASPSNRAITFALTQLKRLEEAKIPFIIIAGNHSTPRTSTSSPILQALRTLDNIHPVFEQHYEKVEFDDVIFHALPHVNDERIIPDELEQVEASIDAGRKNILMMHCSVGAHYLMHEFGEWVFPKEKEYLFEKMDYVALGHWHGFGAVGKHKNVFYSGSTERTSSSDKREEKGYVLLDFENGPSVELNTINLRRTRSFTIDTEHYEEAVAGLDLSGIEDALVEVVLTNLTTATSIDITNKEIAAIFGTALHVKVKREFKAAEGSASPDDIESVSLESCFVSHIVESVESREEQERLAGKAKALFARYEESDDDAL